MELYLKMMRRFAVILVGAGVILLFRFFVANNLSPSNGGWHEKRWPNLYTTILLKAEADSLLLNSVIFEIDTFFTRYTSHYSNNGPLNRAIENGQPGERIPLNSEEWELLSFAQNGWNETGGAIHPGIGNLLQLWGLTSGSTPHRPDSAQLQREVERLETLFFELDSSSRELVLKQSGVKIALGSFLKGWAIDRAAEQLLQHGVRNFMLNVGGDIRCNGKSPRNEPWRIGLQNPESPEKLTSTLLLGGELPCAMASSGGYQQQWTDSTTGERHHHILDPRTGKSARGLEATTVIAPTALQADLWATWLFVVGADSAKALLSKSDSIHGYLIESGEPNNSGRNSTAAVWGTPKLIENLNR